MSLRMNICGKCNEGYDPDIKHICGKSNSVKIGGVNSFVRDVLVCGLCGERCGELIDDVCRKCYDVLTQKQDDPVDHPSHYNTGNIEVIDFIEDKEFGYHESNVIKYVSRARHKGKELEDLRKASWYLNRRIKQLES